MTRLTIADIGRTIIPAGFNLAASIAKNRGDERRNELEQSAQQRRELAAKQDRAAKRQAEAEEARMALEQSFTTRLDRAVSRGDVDLARVIAEDARQKRIPIPDYTPAMEAQLGKAEQERQAAETTAQLKALENMVVQTGNALRTEGDPERQVMLQARLNGYQNRLAIMLEQQTPSAAQMLGGAQQGQSTPQQGRVSMGQPSTTPQQGRVSMGQPSTTPQQGRVSMGQPSTAMQPSIDSEDLEAPAQHTQQGPSPDRWMSPTQLGQPPGQPEFAEHLRRRIFRLIRNRDGTPEHERAVWNVLHQIRTLDAKSPLRVELLELLSQQYK